MIRALRKKFILACMFALTLVLFVILGGVNFVSYRKVVELSLIHISASFLCFIMALPRFRSWCGICPAIGPPSLCCP